MICSRCGSPIPSKLTVCPACRTPVEFSARDRESMDVDIRARVLWGDPVDQVQEDWRKRGAPEPLLQTALQAALQERRTHFRTRGIQDFVIALLLFLMGLGAYGLYGSARHGGLVLRPKTAALVMVASVVLPLAGLALSFRGVRRLVIGGEVDEAASDLSEVD